MISNFYRDARLGRSTKNEDGDLIVELAMASEEPYERWWGVEILKINDKSVRLERLNDGASLLSNHDWNDLRGVHVAKSTRADPDNVLRGKVRIQSATQVGRDTVALVKSGVLTKSSVGYRVHRVIEKAKTKQGEDKEREIDGDAFERMIRSLEESGNSTRAAFCRELDSVAGPIDRSEDDPTIYYVVDWEPHENSLVTIPADPTVGVGRGARQRGEPKLRLIPKQSEVTTMDEERSAAVDTADATTGAADHTADIQTRVVQASAGGGSVIDHEKGRKASIIKLGKLNKIDQRQVDRWITEGASLNQVADDLVLILGERGATNPESASRLDLTAKETQRYSLSRAILAVRDSNWKKAGFEAESSRAICEKLNKVPDPNRFYVPFEVQQRAIGPEVMDMVVRHLASKGVLYRDLTSAGASGSQFLVSTTNLGFVELLRNLSVMLRMGTTELPGLRDNITIPKQSAAGTAFWLSTEATAITESQPTFLQLALSPKNVGGYTEISRQMLLQSSPQAEGLVTADLAAIVALAIDAAGLNGSGAAGQPLGIIGTAGIGSVLGTTLGYPGIVEFQTDTAGGNALFDSSGYVSTPAVAGLLKQRVKFTSTASPIWEGQLINGQVDGYRALASLQMPAANMLFGNFATVLLASWGVLEIEVNPYANFPAGIVGVRAMASVDIGVRYPTAFSLATTIT